MNILSIVDKLTYDQFVRSAKEGYKLQTLEAAFFDGPNLAKRYQKEYCPTHREKKQELFEDGEFLCETCLNGTEIFENEWVEDER